MEQYMDQEAFFTSPLRDYVTLADMSRELRVSIALAKKIVEKNGLRAAKRHGVVRLWKRRDIALLRQILEQATAESRR